MTEMLEFSGYAELPWGEAPGNNFHTVEVTVTRRTTGRWQCRIDEEWGSNQGVREVHGTHEVSGFGTTHTEAIQVATERAKAVEIHDAYLVQALSRAERKIEDWLDSQGQPTEDC